MTKRTLSGVNKTWVRRAIIALVVTLHIAGVAVNFDALLFGRNPTVVGSAVTVLYAVSWLTLAVVAGRTSGGRAFVVIAVLWIVIVAAAGLAFSALSAFEATSADGGLLAPVVLALVATPLYGISGVMRGLAPIAAYIASAIVLGGSCCLTALIASRRRRSGETGPIDS